MSDIWQTFLATARFMTLLPLPATNSHRPPHLAMLPLVGLLLGSLLVIMGWLSPASSPWVTALLITISWFVLTGFLHLDGLADVTDGLAAAHHDRSRLLEIMKEPHVGSFAVIALVLVILSKFILVAAMVSSTTILALLLIPAWSRLGAAWWAGSLPLLGEGLASWCSKAEQSKLIIWLAVLLILSLLLSPLMLFAPLVLWGWSAFLSRKFGGMNGDCLGAGIEVCEVAMLFLYSVTL